MEQEDNEPKERFLADWIYRYLEAHKIEKWVWSNFPEVRGVASEEIFSEGEVAYREYRWDTKKKAEGTLECSYCGRQDILVQHHWFEKKEYRCAMVCHRCNSLLPDWKFNGNWPPRGIQKAYCRARLPDLMAGYTGSRIAEVDGSLDVSCLDRDVLIQNESRLKYFWTEGINKISKKKRQDRDYMDLVWRSAWADLIWSVRYYLSGGDETSYWSKYIEHKPEKVLSSNSDRWTGIPGWAGEDFNSRLIRYAEEEGYQTISTKSGLSYRKFDDSEIGSLLRW